MMMAPTAGRILALAAFNGFVAVLLGAMESHTLASHFTPEGAAWFKTGLNLQVATTPAFLGAALLGQFGIKRWAHNSALASLIGVLAFSGSLYVLALSGPGSLGPLHWITPLGGLALMVGWVLLAIGALRSAGATGHA